MPKLGLGTGIGRSGIVTPGVVTDNLVMKHMYPAGGVQPLSDGACFFDGTDDFMSASAVLATGTTMSWSLWMKTTADSGWSGIIASNVDPAYDSWVFRRNTDNTYEWVVDWDIHSEFPAAAVEDNQWHHVAGTYDGSNIKLYLDGVLYDTIHQQTELGQRKLLYANSFRNGKYSCELGLVSIVLLVHFFLAACV